MAGTVKEEALKLRENLDKVYDAGHKVGYDNAIADMCEEATHTNKTVKMDCPGEFPMAVTSAITVTQEGSGDPYFGDPLAIIDDGWKDNANWTEEYVEGSDRPYRYYYVFDGMLDLGNYWWFASAGSYLKSNTNFFISVDAGAQFGPAFSWQITNTGYPIPGMLSNPMQIVYEMFAIQFRLCIDMRNPIPDDVNFYGDVFQSFGIYSVGDSGIPTPANIRPIVGHNEIKLTHCGKNLLHEDWKSFKNYTYKQNLALSLPKGKYVISAEKTDTTYLYLQRSTDGGVTIETYSRLHTNNTQTVNSVAFEVTGAEGEVWMLWTSGQKYLDVIKWAQIECGDVATPYEPYRSDTFAIDLGQTVYGGTYNWQKGELTVAWKLLTCNGTEQWTYYNSYSKITSAYVINLPDKVIGYGTSLCNQFHNIKSQKAWQADNMTAGTYSDHTTLPRAYFDWGEPIDNTDTAAVAASLAAFKTWLKEQYDAGTPVEICYQLATPTVIKLTPREIVSLHGTNILNSNTGDTTVTATVTGKQVEYDRFWDAYQYNGKRVTYSYAFADRGWNNETFKPKYDMQPTLADSMFNTFNGNADVCIDLVNTLAQQNVTLDFSKCTKMGYCFYAARILRIGTIDLSSATDVTSVFNSPYLVTIDKLIPPNLAMATTCWQGGLENLTIDGTITNNINLSRCSKLTDASVQSIIDHLAFLNSPFPDQTTQTLTLHADVGAKLTDEQKADISSRNWTLVY